jgi:tRNA(fMet)-specific endonuclease VapC
VVHTDPAGSGHEQLERAYRRLADAVRFFADLQIINFSRAALSRHDALVALKLNIGKMDIRIAAIVLEAGATLVTRNLRDFRRVPDLVIEDWAEAPAAESSSPDRALNRGQPGAET